MKFWEKNKINISVLSAILSAVFYAICIPFAKILNNHIEPVMLGGFLYFGAGLGLGIFRIFSKTVSNPLGKKELPYIIAVISLDILAIIFLMTGLNKSTGANASLIGNFELVATSLFAFIIFKEVISKKLFFSVVLITVACTILTFEGADSFKFNLGSVFVLLSCLCWGLENNCTRKISSKSTKQITMYKGIGSGVGSLLISTILRETIPEIKYIVYALVLGFVSYGLSVCLYIYAQRFLGSVKTGAYYAAAPFIGVVLSLIILGEIPSLKFYTALIFMIGGTVLVVRDTKNS